MELTRQNNTVAGNMKANQQQRPHRRKTCRFPRCRMQNRVPDPDSRRARALRVTARGAQGARWERRAGPPPHDPGSEQVGSPLPPHAGIRGERGSAPPGPPRAALPTGCVPGPVRAGRSRPPPRRQRAGPRSPRGANAARSPRRPGAPPGPAALTQPERRRQHRPQSAPAVWSRIHRPGPGGRGHRLLLRPRRRVPGAHCGSLLQAGTRST